MVRGMSGACIRSIEQVAVSHEHPVLAEKLSDALSVRHAQRSGKGLIVHIQGVRNRREALALMDITGDAA